MALIINLGTGKGYSVLELARAFEKVLKDYSLSHHWPKPRRHRRRLRRPLPRIEPAELEGPPQPRGHVH